MDIFDYRNQLVDDYAAYVKSFIHIRDERINEHVHRELNEGVLWPQPLIQLNPSFQPGEYVDELVREGVLHQECARIFQKDKPEGPGEGRRLRLHRHQVEAIRAARGGHNYVLTTGTGSGKSLAYIVPIVDHVLRRGTGRGIQAIVVYPMNALANSQYGELTKFLKNGYADGKGPVTFARYTGQESDEERQRIKGDPPDIILTNYVMLELILTRPNDSPLIRSAQGLRFLVLDELHTYRGRQGADVALLIRRTRDRLAAAQLQCVGTSATLAREGTHEEQQAEAARVASLLFGAEVKADHVIGETLRRVTPTRDTTDSTNFREDLIHRLTESSARPPADFQGFVNDPLSIWIESTFGITNDPRNSRLVRSKPMSVRGREGAARRLSDLTGIGVDRCVEAIQDGLLAGYGCEPNPETGFPVFAFRLHQFISRGDTAYASLESEPTRKISLSGQQYVPGDRSRVLLPLVFCRECGQEYYTVRAAYDHVSRKRTFTPRDVGDQFDDQDSHPGFLYVSGENPWPSEIEHILERVPDDWVEEHRLGPRVRSDRRGNLPQPARVGPDGRETESGLECHFIPAPFRFCLHCGVSYDFRQSDDFAKLATLGSEGRSTATTVLTLSAIRHLRDQPDLADKARKLLSFTDNRQDASLQAGHFNDFVEIGLLRSALYRAACDAGPDGIRHEELTQKVFDALALPLDRYAVDSAVRFAALNDTKRALRDVLGYRLYRDLKRGWRITSPNLEQSGLLEIHYLSLDEVCEAEDVWEKTHPALAGASPKTRATIAKVLLDFMRRELAIKVDYLTPHRQESIQQQSSQRLVSPWALDENETLEQAGILFPRSRGSDDFRGNVYLSPRSGFGQYLRRKNTFPNWNQKLNMGDVDKIIDDLLAGLKEAGLVEIVVEPKTKEEKPGYQLPASAMVWVAGDGTHAAYDPVRMPSESAVGHRTNPFFVEFYQSMAAGLAGLIAREHTAQVPAKLRQDREDEFREGKLPILYCSPTMELGVDISELNVVNMRNVPPTPANYAQRSGRAGRSGQPALVFTYCSLGSPHDQYFFKRPDRMVSGSVTPPRLDLANEDLVRAHVHAIWLAETGQDLGQSLKDLLDVEGEAPSLKLQAVVRDSLNAERPRQQALVRGERTLETFKAELLASDWYKEEWLARELDQVVRRFDQACERWRDLYRAALSQAEAQDKIIRDASRSIQDKQQAERLRREAEEQLRLLTEIDTIGQSDFYSYRYFASEGFLPGYSFPRLPLSAYIPARRTRQREGDEFLSRPRFLAISEFGPRAIVYHEGSRYLINKVILPPRVEGEGQEQALFTHQAKRCEECGYLHPVKSGNGPDLCERCGAYLDRTYRSLFRLQNVSTKRRDRISSDEEERMRLGYEIITSLRFPEHDSQSTYRRAAVEREGKRLAEMTYGNAATLWRINLGWSRRKNKQQFGFVLDTERGYWEKSDLVPDEDDPMSARKSRVIPYVEDRRNCLVFEPKTHFDEKVMASLQASLKSAIQVEYQLEDSEVASEPLPSADDRRLILLYESAEGGAGVLRQLVDDREALGRVARTALELCHFDREAGADLRKAPHAREECEAACYDCLMSYTNQRDHALLDRFTIRDILLQLAYADVQVAPGSVSRDEHLERLMRLCGSDLERQWLRHLRDHGHRLPSDAQKLIAACATRPDFVYENEAAVIYVDGPHHDYPERRARDAILTDALEDQGYCVIRFGYQADWDAVLANYPSVFGRRT